MSDDFFEEQKEQSKIKTEIVVDYFKQWSKVLVSTIRQHGQRYGTSNLVYMDLFSGPGKYEDGTPSTPLRVLAHAIEDPHLQKMLICLFNDIDNESVKKLENSIKALPGIENLSNFPRLYQGILEPEFLKLLSSRSMPPTLLFADPFGYKGLTLELINAVLKDFGGEAIFFFNYNRTQAAIKNPLVSEHMNALFGQERADALREIENGSGDKEQLILDALLEALTANYGNYYCTFRFQNTKKDSTSHYLIFVTKHKKGYEIMKSIMAKSSDFTSPFGVASFEHTPDNVRTLSLFNPIDSLAETLHKKFKGQRLCLDDFWIDESVGTPFLRKNFVDAVHKLHDMNMVSWEGQSPAKRTHCSAKTIIFFK